MNEPDPEANAREMMRIQAEALFTHDLNGRLSRVNEPNGARAPRFFLGRTAQGRVWRFRDDLGAANGGPLSAEGLDALVSELLALTKRELDR